MHALKVFFIPLPLQYNKDENYIYINKVEKQQKEAILAWSLERFRKKGIRSVTMDEIASHAGVSKRTLYEQFVDKELLLIECLKYHESLERNALFAYAASQERNVLEMILFSFNQKMSECCNTSLVFTHDMVRYPKVMNFVNERNRLASCEFIEALKIGVEQGLMRDDIRFELFEDFITTQMRFFYEESVWKKYKPQEVFRLILLLWLRGITTEAGSTIIDTFLKNEMPA